MWVDLIVIFQFSDDLFEREENFSFFAQIEIDEFQLYLEKAVFNKLFIDNDLAL